MNTLEKRLEALEASTGGDGSCERCRGLLVTVVDAVTGEHHSATWNGEAISEEEAIERRAEARCPRCGRERDPAAAPVIRLGYDGWLVTRLTAFARRESGAEDCVG